MFERHAIELPERAFTLTPEQAAPARDPFVELGQERPGPHADLNHALILGEVAASSAVEADDPQTRLTLARLAELHLQRTAAIDAELEAPWGSEPVDVSAYARLMALSPADRLEQLVRESGRSHEDPAL